MIVTECTLRLFASQVAYGSPGGGSEGRGSRSKDNDKYNSTNTSIAVASRRGAVTTAKSDRIGRSFAEKFKDYAPSTFCAKLGGDRVGVEVNACWNGTRGRD